MNYKERLERVKALAMVADREAEEYERILKGYKWREVESEKAKEAKKKAEKSWDDSIDYAALMLREISTKNLTELEVTVLHQFYWLGKDWKGVAAFVGYSYSHTRRIANNAIKKLSINDITKSV